MNINKLNAKLIFRQWGNVWFFLRFPHYWPAQFRGNAPAKETGVFQNFPKTFLISTIKSLIVRQIYISSNIARNCSRVTFTSRIMFFITSSGTGSLWVWKVTGLQSPSFDHISWPPFVRSFDNPNCVNANRSSLNDMFDSFFTKQSSLVKQCVRSSHCCQTAFSFPPYPFGFYMTEALTRSWGFSSRACASRQGACRAQRTIPHIFETFRRNCTDIGCMFRLFRWCRATGNKPHIRHRTGTHRGRCWNDTLSFLHLHLPQSKPCSCCYSYFHNWICCKCNSFFRIGNKRIFSLFMLKKYRLVFQWYFYFVFVVNEYEYHSILIVRFFTTTLAINKFSSVSIFCNDIFFQICSTKIIVLWSMVCRSRQLFITSSVWYYLCFCCWFEAAQKVFFVVSLFGCLLERIHKYWNHKMACLAFRQSLLKKTIVFI